MFQFHDAHRTRCLAALLSGALLTGAWLLGPSAARADDSDFAGLIPGRLVAEEELARIHGKGATTLTVSSTGAAGAFVVAEVAFRIARIKRSVRLPHLMARDSAGKNAARAAFGSPSLPRISIVSEFVEFSVISTTSQ